MTCRATYLASASLISLALALPAFGAESAADPSGLEEVIVTGSRIVREGYEAPTPLTVVDAAAIANSGTSNVADFVNTMPVFSGSASPTSSQNGVSVGTGGVNLLNLRNLGAPRTLVLLDGQRSVGSLLTGVVDINVFPQQLIQRVDVVTGGASAVYGSDAVSGVVNFILDKQFTGVKGEISGGMTSYIDGEGYKIGLSGGFGFSGGRGHVLASGEQVYKSRIGPVRDWIYVGAQIFNNPAYTATNGQPRLLNYPSQAGNSNATLGGIVVSGPLKGTYFDVGGVPRQFNYGEVVSDPSMHGGDWQYSDVHARGNAVDVPESRQNAFLRVSYDITDRINVFASAAWGSTLSDYPTGPIFQQGIAATGASAIKLDNPFIPAETRARMIALGVTTLTLGSFNGDLPSYAVDDQRMVNRWVVGANGSFGAFGTDWTWDAYFQTGHTRSSVRAANVPYRDRLVLAGDAVRNANGQIVCRSTLTNPNNGCVPYNQMGIGVNSDAVREYLVGTAFLYQTMTQNVWEATVGGEPLSIWAGPVSVSANIAHRQEKATGISDSNSQRLNWFAGNYFPLIGSYSVTEGALETVVPLAKGESWADAWDLSAAVRATSYSTSGYVTTWKLGTTYTPMQDVRLRVTRSRDIRAPNLEDLYQPGSGSTQNLFDPFRNQTTQIRGLAVGNPNLTPEIADTIGLGVVLAPRFAPGLTVSADYWDIRIKNGIASLGGQSVIDLCFGGTRPDLCQSITRNPPLAGETIGTILVVQTGRYNVANQNAKGIDFEGTYRFGADDLFGDTPGDFLLHANATLYLRNYTNPGFPGGVRTQTVGQNDSNGPPDWRLTATLGYNLDPFQASLTMRAISAGVYNNNYIVCTTGCPTSSPQNETITSNSIVGAKYFDASLIYKFGIGEDVRAEAFFNVRNIANQDPPIIGYRTIQFVVFNTNATLYDTIGRVFRAGVRFQL